MQTGGGPGDLENYTDFKLRDPENFSRYNKQFGAMLTWIHMLDEQHGGALSGLF